MSETTNPSIIARIKARYAAQAARPDAARARQITVVAVLICSCLLGGYRLVRRAIGSEATELSFVQGKLPTCDSPFAANLLKQTIEENTSPLIGPVKVYKVGQTLDYMGLVLEVGKAQGAKAEPGADERLNEYQNNQRSCAAQVFTSRGQHRYNFSLAWTSDAKDEVYLQAELGE